MQKFLFDSKTLKKTTLQHYNRHIFSEGKSFPP